MSYTPIIGLEIHVELNTNSKMFCGCPADHFSSEPNTNICPVCFGLPGALPVANIEGIRRTIKIGLALGSSITTHSKFDRKNYFYPDLPKGYQISQYDQPLCVGGSVATDFGVVNLERVHLEEDTAKLQHVSLTAEEMARAGVDSSDVSLVDFNRSGVPLVEIVTKPDIHSGAQAREFAKNLVHILRYLGVSDCDMEKGSLRLEANISVQNPEEKSANRLPAYKVEIKNLNSFRFLERSIKYEIDRHTKMRELGELPKQETRGWNDQKGVTYSQRSKEEAEDYRYFPDPDLAPLNISEQMIAEIKADLPELPASKIERWVSEFGISQQNAAVLGADINVAQAVEMLLQASQSAKVEAQQVVSAVVNHKVETWLTDVPKVINAKSGEIDKEVSRVIDLVLDLYRVDTLDQDELEKIVLEVITDPANKSAVENYKNGKVQVMGVFIGQVMKKLNKKIDAKIVREMVKKTLEE